MQRVERALPRVPGVTLAEADESAALLQVILAASRQALTLYEQLATSRQAPHDIAKSIEREKRDIALLEAEIAAQGSPPARDD